MLINYIGPLITLYDRQYKGITYRVNISINIVESYHILIYSINILLG